MSTASPPPPLPSEIDELCMDLAALYRPVEPQEAAEKRQIDDNDISKLTLQDFMQDVAAFLVQEKLREQERRQNELESHALWLGTSIDKLEHAKKDLQNFEEKLTQMELERSYAVQQSETLTVTCDSLGKESAQIEDMISTIRQRTLHFERLHDLRKEIGADPHAYVSKMTLNAFQLQEDKDSNKRHPLHEKFVAIDESCMFLTLHQDFLEAPEYLRGLEKLRSELLLGVRQVVGQTIERCEAQIERQQKRMSQADGNVAQTVARNRLNFASHYVQFRVAGLHIKSLVNVVLERAVVESAPAYSDCLDMMEGLYVAIRLRIIADAVRNQLHAVIDQHQSKEDGASNIALAVRQAVTYIISVAQLELKTFYSIFVARPEKFMIPLPQSSMSTLFTTLATILLEVLRPVILSCQELRELRDIAEALSLDVLEVVPSMSSSKVVSAEFTPSRLINTDDLNLIYSAVLRLHKDIQERLIFKTELFSISSIRGYVGTSDKLDYPSNLFKPPGPKFAICVSQDSSSHNRTTMAFISTPSSSSPEAEPQSMSSQPTEIVEVPLSSEKEYYPSLTRLVDCLFLVSDVVSKAAFQVLSRFTKIFAVGSEVCQNVDDGDDDDDDAEFVCGWMGLESSDGHSSPQRTVEGCVTSLFEAADDIKSRKGNSFDSDLFLIKHLLMLREQVSNFNCELVGSEVTFDFTKTIRKVKGVLGFGGPAHTQLMSDDLSPHSSPLSTTVQSLVPEMHESRIDTRKDLEVALKQHCESLVAHCSSLVLFPLLRLASLLLESERSHHKAAAAAAIEGTAPVIGVPLSVLEDHTTEFIAVHAEKMLRTESIPIVISNPSLPQCVLFNAMKISISEVMRHVQDKVISFPYFTTATKETELPQPCSAPSLESLEQDFGWWQPSQLGNIMACLMKESIPPLPLEAAAAAENEKL